MDIENDEDRKETLSRVFDDLAAAEAPNPPDDAEPVDAAPEDAVEPTEAKPEAPDSAKARDEAGKFKKTPRGAGSKSPVVPTARQGSTPAAVPGQAPTVAPVAAAKPPQSWKPAIREKWASLPPEVQQEVLRRESETATAVQKTAEKYQEADRGWQQFKNVVGPYAGMIQSQGGDIFRTTQNLFQSMAALTQGSAPQRAEIAAQIIKSYGVDINLLAGMLDGHSAPPQQQHAQQQQYDPALIAQQVEQQVMQRFQAQRNQSLGQKGAQEVEAFSANKEFIDDVRHEMADLMEVAARRGVALSLEDAYNRAVQLHPDVSPVIQQRAKATQANASQASTQRARAASSSVRTDPVARNASPKSDDRKSDVYAAWEALQK